MEVTLDDYLDEVDRWKEAAREQVRDLSETERAEKYREARMRLERKIGRRLNEARDTTSPPLLPQTQESATAAASQS